MEKYNYTILTAPKSKHSGPTETTLYYYTEKQAERETKRIINKGYTIISITRK